MINEREKYKELIKYLLNLTDVDIDLIDKISNLNEGGQITFEYEDLINSQINQINDYIKENAIDFVFEIWDETETCFNYDCCERYDWSAGLYNCDDLYLNAIESVVRKLPKSEFKSPYEVLEKIEEMIREYNNGSDEITADEVLDCIQTIVLENTN